MVEIRIVASDVSRLRLIERQVGSGVCDRGAPPARARRRAGWAGRSNSLSW